MQYIAFIIWGNGIQYKDEILEQLNQKFNIQHITHYNIINLQLFIDAIYKHDKHPRCHIIEKTKYLKSVKNECIFIFGTVSDAKIIYKGRVGKIEAVEKLKWELRELYNPKDPSISIKPLSKGISHNHVIHSSDDETEALYIKSVFDNSNQISTL